MARALRRSASAPAPGMSVVVLSPQNLRRLGKSHQLRHGWLVRRIAGWSGFGVSRLGARVRDMKNFLVGLAAFGIGAVAIIAIVQSSSPSRSTASDIQPMTTTPAMTTTTAMTTGVGTMGGTAAAANDMQLRIVHVQRGCHIWRSDTGKGAMMRITLSRGARLSILDQDVDPHQLVQLGGPRLHMPGPMGMSDRGQLRFTRAGTYRLATKVVELSGQSMTEVKTVGPDNRLSLTVTVV